MAQSLVQYLSSLIGLGGTVLRLADQTLSLFQTVTSSSMDFGATIFSKGAVRIRIKGPTATTGSNAGIGLVTDNVSGFTVNKVIAAAFTLMSTVGEQSMVAEFDVGPQTFRYARVEVLGTGVSNLITLDVEVLATP